MEINIRLVNPTGAKNCKFETECLKLHKHPDGYYVTGQVCNETGENIDPDSISVKLYHYNPAEGPTYEADLVFEIEPVGEGALAWKEETIKGPLGEEVVTGERTWKPGAVLKVAHV